MSRAPDRYSHIQFAGAKRPRVLEALPPRWLRPLQAAPSPSIFAQDHRPHAPVISPADRLLLDFIFKRVPLNGAAYRAAALGRRIPACLRALQARSPAEAVRRLEEDPAAIDLAVNALLIGVTTFFRDLPVFHHLRQVALPALLHESPMPRMLSVGCSDGAEVYSLAICLLERKVESFEVRGIDCRKRAIQRARAGHYPTSALAHLSPEERTTYFDLHSNLAHVKMALRQRVQFQLADAFIHLPRPTYDLVACRNVAIYLEHPAAARLWRRLHNALRPGGLLLTGKAERPMSGFLRAGPCLFRKASP